MTSYTLGFIGGCEGTSIPYFNGHSCTMVDNSSVIDECFSSDLFLIAASGNNGNIPIILGQPIILHKICFDFDITETVNLEKDNIMGLTVSVDSINTENPITEFPAFTSTLLSNENCPCNIELLSPAGSTNQILNCTEEMDSVMYSIVAETGVNVTVTGLPEGVSHDMTDNVLSVFGNPEELGIFTINVNVSAPCDTSLVINLEVQTPTCVMNKNHCYPDMMTALEDVVVGDTIRIVCSIITDEIIPVTLPPDIFVKVENNAIWSIQDE